MALSGALLTNQPGLRASGLCGAWGGGRAWPLWAKPMPSARPIAQL